jgi:hypothetical protein
MSPHSRSGNLAILQSCILALMFTGCASGPRPKWLGPTSGDAGQKVLAKGREMVAKGVVLPGSCWDYINAVYTRAGYPESRRQKVYKTAKKGPYASISLIKPGDWLYFVNHSYGGIEHSSIFVEWIDKGRRQARMLSYAGQNRREPGRYLPYDVSDTFGIIRPVP